jgi:hypothetical protein
MEKLSCQHNIAHRMICLLRCKYAGNKERQNQDENSVRYPACLGTSRKGSHFISLDSLIHESAFVRVHSTNPELNQYCDRIDMWRLGSGIIVFALIVEIGRKALSKFFMPTRCGSVSGPAFVLR